MPAPSTPLRRRPVQQRSAQRVERMLDSCAELIDEVGYDGVTTTLIAERAGVAVGSLYQFFPDKRAVVQALTKRNLDNYLAAIAKRLDGVEFEHWWDAAEIALDEYTRMFREVRGFRRIRFGDVVDMRLMDDGLDNNTVISDRLAALIAERFGLPFEQVRLPVVVATTMADATLNLAFRQQVFDEATVIEETRRIVHGYLSGRLGGEHVSRS